MPLRLGRRIPFLTRHLLPKIGPDTSRPASHACPLRPWRPQLHSPRHLPRAPFVCFAASWSVLRLRWSQGLYSPQPSHRPFILPQRKESSCRAHCISPTPPIKLHATAHPSTGLLTELPPIHLVPPTKRPFMHLLPPTELPLTRPLSLRFRIPLHACVGLPNRLPERLLHHLRIVYHPALHRRLHPLHAMSLQELSVTVDGDLNSWWMYCRSRATSPLASILPPTAIKSCRLSVLDKSNQAT